MARITEKERENAVIIDGTGGPINDDVMQIGDRDSETAWDDWIEKLKESEASGTVSAHKYPVDADGNPISGKGARMVRLGSWPHNLYDFDALCSKIVREFLKPGETAHIRFQGNAQGVRGNMFTRAVTLQRPATDETPAGSVDFAGLMRAFQDSQERQAQMIERLMQPRESAAPSVSSDTIKSIALAAIPVVGSIITAVVSRPAPKSELSQMIGALVQLKELVPGMGGNDNDSDDTMAAIIKSVGPGAMQLLTTLAANNGGGQPVPRQIPVRQIAPRTGAASDMRPSVPINPGTSPKSEPNYPGNPEPAKSGTPIHVAEHQEVNPMLAQLAPQLDQLAALAAQGADPSEVAKLVMDQLPPGNEDFDEQLYDTLNDEAKFKRLLLLSPALAKHAQWVEQLRQSLLSEFVPDEPDVTTPV